MRTSFRFRVQVSFYIYPVQQQREGDLTVLTVYLIDEQHRFLAKHSRIHPDIVLVPAPSDDPDDPLNWSHRRKILSTVCTSLYVLLLGISTAAIYSVLVPISKATGLSVHELNAGTGYMVCPKKKESHISNLLLIGASSSFLAGDVFSGNRLLCSMESDQCF